MINKIIDETGADIDIEDDGLVKIMTADQEGGQQAKKMIERLTEEVEVGKIYQGTVKKIMDFGAFVEILPNKDGLVHISKLADRHVKEVGDVVSVGDEIPVKVIEIDNQDRINLSLKDAKKELKDKE
jgi:polyribonucleotide nucleotidyltransferase